MKLNSDYSGGTAERAEGTGRITYADLTAASQTGATLTYGGAPGKVKVSAAVDVLGKTVTHSVVSTISLVDAPDGKGGKLVRVHADEVPGAGIPGVEKLIRKKTDFERNLRGRHAGRAPPLGPDLGRGRCAPHAGRLERGGGRIVRRCGPIRRRTGRTTAPGGGAAAARGVRIPESGRSCLGI